MMLSLNKHVFCVLLLAAFVSLCCVNGELECYSNATDRCNFESHKLNTSYERSADCCLGNGYWYKLNGSNECVQCIVYGFTEKSITIDEGSILRATITVLKGTPIVRVILFAVQSLDGSATHDLDYRPVIPSVYLRGRIPTTISQGIIADSMAFEGVESYSLNLYLLRPTTLSSNEFIQRTLNVYISDRTSVSFKLTEADYLAKEETGFVAIGVAKASNIKLAQAVSLVARPVSLNADIMLGIPSDGHGLSSTGNTDFIDSVIDGFEFQFPATGTINEITVKLPIINDDVNEVDEEFMIVLELSPKEELKADYVTFDRSSAVCTILDDDEISIGFQEGSYTFSEGSGVVSLNLLKFPRNRTSEQDFEFNIFAERSGEGDFVVGRDVNIESKTTINFLSIEQQKIFEISLLDDPIPESNERFSLRLVHSSVDGYRPLCHESLGCHSFVTVTIEDNDEIEIGFTKSLIEVAEEAGNVEACVAVKQPNTSVSLELFIFLDIVMSPGSAGSEDYYDQKLNLESLDNTQRIQCVNVSIFEDDLKEGQENFTLRIVPDTSLPLLTISPAATTIQITDNESVEFWCLLLSDPRDGEVTVSSEHYFLGDVATYSCHPGFFLHGIVQRTCLISRVWSDSQPSCKRVCEPLINPPNGVVSAVSLFVGDNSTYSCYTGYRLFGSSLRTCQPDGEWSGTEPSCQRACPTLVGPQNGSVTVSSYFVGGIATFDCSPGTKRAGLRLINCLSSGQWSGPEPSCLTICPTLVDHSNGNVRVSSYNTGGIATYTCHFGFGLVGSANRQCQSSGNWNGSYPSCLRTCGSLEGLIGGGVTISSHFVDGIATYTCSAGYELVGTSSRICQPDGEWSTIESEPYCERVELREELETVHEAILPVEKIKTVTSLVGEIVPAVLKPSPTTATPGIHSLADVDDEDDDDDDDSIDSVYTVLAKSAGTRVTDVGLSSFTGATSLISISKDIACSSNVTFTQDDFIEAVAQIAHEYDLGRDKDYQRIRSALGKILCINERGVTDNIESKRKRRDARDCPDPSITSCPCPEIVTSIDEICCVCEFFTCLKKLNTPDVMADSIDVLGDGIGLGLTLDHCLAFVVDTSGSMRNEIEGAVRIIKEFVINEAADPWCYVLLRFHDDDPSGIVSEDVISRSIGPVIVADTADLVQLREFNAHLDGLRDLDHGHDWEEFCFDGILKALKEVDIDDFEYLSPGSQIVVITDAATKRMELKDDIISYASAGICVNFFLSDVTLALNYFDISPDSEDNPFKVYYELATATNGNAVNDYSSWRLADFLTRSDYVSCDSGSRRRKRSAPRQCDTFRVSSLATFFKLAIEASPHSILTISHPSSADSTTTVGYDSLAIFSERKPQPGTYTVCVNTGEISHISFSESVSMDVAFLYLSTEKSDGSDVTTIPPACSSGKISIVTSKAKEISTATLRIQTPAGRSVNILPLSKYDKDILTSTVLEFPVGKFEYYLNGQDKSGVIFEYNTRTTVRFDASLSCSLEYSGDSTPVNLQRYGSTTLSFTFTNLNKHSFEYYFSSTTVTGISKRVTPSQATVSPGASINVDVHLNAVSSAVEVGDTHTFTLTASNACGEKKASKMVTIVNEQVVTTQPTITNVCGCVNGGTCVSITRRGRTRNRCVCPPGYAGALCQVVS